MSQKLISILSGNRINDIDFSNLRFYYANLSSFETIELANLPRMIPEVNQRIRAHIESTADAMKTTGLDMSELSRKLIYLKKISDSFTD